MEDRLGHFNFLILYLFSAIFSALVQLLVMSSMGNGVTPLVGASGAIAAVMGSYLYLFPHAALYQTIIIPYPIKIPVTIYLGVWTILQFVGHAYSKSNVGWWAHLSGFFIGLGITWIWWQMRHRYSPLESSE